MIACYFCLAVNRKTSGEPITILSGIACCLRHIGAVELGGTLTEMIDRARKAESQ